MARNFRTLHISQIFVSTLTFFAVLTPGRSVVSDHLDKFPRTPVEASGHDDSAQLAELERLAREGRDATLEPRLQTYLHQHPSSPRAYYLLGCVYFRQMKIDDSIRALSRAVELDGQDAEARALLGWVLLIAKRCDLAQNELEKAVELEPHWGEGRYRLGRVYLQEEDFVHARSEFEKAIEMRPDYPEAYNALGVTLEALNDGPGALASLQKAVEIGRATGKPFDPALVNISGYYNRRGDPLHAIEFAQKALAVNPTADLAYFELGRAYRIEEKWSQAETALERAIVLNPASAQYHYVLGIVYRKLGKQAESRAALETFRELDRKFAESEAQRPRGRTMSSHRDASAYEPATEGILVAEAVR